jgi:hypothetical protein
MGKFNQSTKGSIKTENLAGGVAYKLDLKKRVVLGVLTCFMGEPKFYGDNTNQLVDDIRELISIDARFVANLACFTRTKFYMRSVTHMLIAELANNPKGKPFVREVCVQAIQRVDDMTEVLSYYINHFGKPIPNSLKKGLADAFWKFDEYQFAKYNRDNLQVKIKDLVALVNPSPRVSKKVVDAEKYELINKIYNDNLETPITWETQLSIQDGRSKKEKWEEVIDMWIKVEE